MKTTNRIARHLGPPPNRKFLKRKNPIQYRCEARRDAAAIEWVFWYLVFQDEPKAQTIAAAKAAGMSLTAFNRARGRLGVQTFYRSDRKAWCYTFDAPTDGCKRQWPRKRPLREEEESFDEVNDCERADELPDCEEPF